MSKIKNLSVGIVAGGKSTRMGQNKALMEVNGMRMIEKITSQLGEIDTPLISASEKNIYEEFSNKVVYDENKDIGPIEGIRQLLIHAEDEYIFICAADMPYMKKELVEYLSQFVCSDYDCYVLRDGNKIHPLCAIYSKKLLPLIEKLIKEGKFKLLEIFNNSRTKYIELSYSEFDSKIVKNVNTKEDYIEVSKPFVFAVSGYKNSGKTWLIEKLINEFISDGYTVATLKHDGHDEITENESTDSARFYEAGVFASGIITDTEFMLRVRQKNSKERMIDFIRDLGPTPDIVILEGFKNSDVPKVFIMSDDSGDLPVTIEHIICLATDEKFPNNENLPVYHRGDVSGIFLCVKKFFDLDNK